MRISDWSSDVCSSDLPTPMRSATRWDAAGPTLRIHAVLEHGDDLIADLAAGFARFEEMNRGQQARPGEDSPSPPLPHCNRIMIELPATLPPPALPPALVEVGNFEPQGRVRHVVTQP